MAPSNKPKNHDTVIRVDARPGWYQRSSLGWRSKALSQLMDDHASAALRQFDYLQSVTVTAQCGRASRAITYHRQQAWTRHAA